MENHLPAEFLTGYEEIDKQHEEFLRLSEEVKQCCTENNRKRIKLLYVKLLDHIINHFVYEELLMCKVGFPVEKFRQHREKHRELQNLYLASYRPILSDKMNLEKIIEIFEGQFLYHLQKMDLELTQFIQSQQSQTLP